MESAARFHHCFTTARPTEVAASRDQAQNGNLIPMAKTTPDTAKLWLRRFGICVAVLLAALPLTFVTTFMLMPLWSWIEERFGIESVGHSGPADWCFNVVYLMWFVIAVIGGKIAASQRKHT